LEKSVKVLRKASAQAVFFGLEIAGGIGEVRWEMISRNLSAISRDLARQFARFGDVGKIGAWKVGKTVKRSLESPQFRQLGSSDGINSADNARGRDLARRDRFADLNVSAVVSRFGTRMKTGISSAGCLLWEMEHRPLVESRSRW